MGAKALQRDNFDEIVSEINIIPLVDISLVLLIIFMVTANYIMSPSLTIDLPRHPIPNKFSRLIRLRLIFPAKGRYILRTNWLPALN